ncbi:adenosylmethionine decarboxylase [Colwellia sp. 20A7]|uniref:adenosylmethionine decarboxylase n=1 Tax=Colwellia sp. 20A7 TaxID=2689569 RepID=UPI0013591F8D|nr:adenosylmethionine decarboxylase [Colwellia sp. 20A7]
MFFEGSEKKAEVVVDNTKLSLLNDISNTFWQELVECCNAQILSSIENEHCKAFLLSESSLFVWDDRFLILTCGVTQLVNSIEYFIQNTQPEDILHVTYQRKNEYFSNAQLTSFGDDIKLLSKYLTGKAYRFGEIYSHHNYVFHQDNEFQAEPDDTTYELLAYQISEYASKKLTTKGLSTQEIRDFFCINELLPGFEIDDFVFDPYGYSLNAIKGTDYYTIHVTPQAGSSYVSFESNLDLFTIASKILDILSPSSFDLLGFNDPQFSKKVTTTIKSPYISNSLVSKTLDNGYLVCFASFITPETQYSTPLALDLTGENHAL